MDTVMMIHTYLSWITPPTLSWILFKFYYIWFANILFETYIYVRFLLLCYCFYILSHFGY